MTDTRTIDARNELNHRTRGCQARLARLAAAGAPADHDGLRRWMGQIERRIAH